MSHDIANSNFTFLNYRLNSAGTATTGQTMYNYQGNLTSSDLHNGINNFYVNFKSPGLSSYSDMPWFSLLAKYTTTVKVPQGITTEITNFTDTGGLAIPSAQDLNGDGTKDYGFSYDVNTGQRTFFSNLRRVSWSNFLQKNNAYDNGVPFVLTGIPHVSVKVDAAHLDSVVAKLPENQVVVTGIKGPVEDKINYLNSVLPNKSNVVLVCGFLGMLVGLAGVFIDTIMEVLRRTMDKFRRKEE